MPLLKAMYEGSLTDRGPTPLIWDDMHLDEIAMDPSIGWHFFDDFLHGPVFATTVWGGRHGSWYPFIDSGGEIGPLATEVGGVLRLGTGTTDNNAVALSTGGGISGASGAGFMRVSDTNGQNWMAAFEARIRVSQITAICDIFIGMTEEACADDDSLFDDSDAIVDKDMIGFRLLVGDPDGLDAVHNDGTGEIVVVNEAQVLVADTFYKIGWKFDGKKVYYFVDGVNLNPDAGVLPAATDFPDAEELALTLNMKVKGTTEAFLDVDWIAGAMLGRTY